MKEGNWKLKRKKNHIIYSRPILNDDGESQEQHFTMASTASDCRASKNALATLNRLNDDYEAEDNNNDDDQENQTGSSSHEMLCCVACSRCLPHDQFSKNQLKKAANTESGGAKCKNCIEEQQY